MGVTFLYSFLKKIDALRKVKISEEVEIYRRSENHSPVIVVDAINLMHSLHIYHHLPWLCGGQLKEYKEHLENFIDMFEKEGVVLVFFFDGSNVIFNVDGWIQRRRNTITVINRIFDKVENGESLSNIEDKIIIPNNIWAVTMSVLRRKGCKIKMAIDECDRELAIYAQKNKCMAILATDTDFVIFQTVKTYTTIEMNLSETSFYVYDKKKLIEVLRLRSSELPVFASLVGNDYTSSTNLYSDPFKKPNKVGYFNFEKHFFRTAQYIINLNLRTLNGKISRNDIVKISRDFFHDIKISESLHKSINFYDLGFEQNGYDAIMRNTPDRNWRCVIKMFYEDCPDDGDAFGIMTKLLLQGSNSLEDFRHSDIPPVSEVLKPLRKKLYGVLLFEKPGMKKVEEWFVNGYDTLCKPSFVYPQLPSVYHPGLMALLNRNEEEAKWTLVGDIFNLEPNQAKILSKHLFIPALSFRYVKDKVKILKHEMEALIISAILVRYFSSKQLHLISINHIASRPIRLYNLISHSFGIVRQILQILRNVISIEEAIPYNYQDGKLFHLTYMMICDQHMSTEEILKNFIKSFFESNISLLDTWKEQVDEISAFVSK